MSREIEHRTLGRTGRDASFVGLGRWQLGFELGDANERDALAVLDAAMESGVTFLETADVWATGGARADRPSPHGLDDRSVPTVARSWAPG